MSFIKDLVRLGSPAHWQMSIAIEEPEKITLSALLLSGTVKNKSGQPLPTMNFTGTPEDFDSMFGTKAENAVEETKGFFQNEEAYTTAVETQKKKVDDKRKSVTPPAEKTAAPPPKPPVKDPKTKKFEAAMQVVDELVGKGCVRQAIAKLPKISDFPEFKVKIEARLAELRSKDKGLSLFDDPNPPASESQSTPGSAATDDSAGDASGGTHAKPEESPGETPEEDPGETPEEPAGTEPEEEPNYEPTSDDGEEPEDDRYPSVDEEE